MFGNSDYIFRDNIIVQNSLCTNFSTSSVITNLAIFNLSNYLIIIIINILKFFQYSIRGSK